MLDTIYHQEQSLKHKSIFLQMLNTVTARKEAHISELKDIIAYLVISYPSQNISQYY